MSVEACLLVNSIAIILLGLAVIKNTRVVSKHGSRINEQEDLLRELKPRTNIHYNYTSIADIEAAERRGNERLFHVER